MKPNLKIPFNEKEHTTVQKFGNWSVSPDGTITNEILEYLITPDRLPENDFMINLYAIGENVHDFFGAYLASCRIVGVKELKIKTNFL